jgi:hypothetical protein
MVDKKFHNISDELSILETMLSEAKARMTRRIINDANNNTYKFRKIILHIKCDIESTDPFNLKCMEGYNFEVDRGI